jgi:hypothetical protein
VRGFGFLAELTEDERSVARDRYQLRGVDGKASGGELGPTHSLETYGALDRGTRRSSLAAIRGRPISRLWEPTSSLEFSHAQEGKFLWGILAITFGQTAPTVTGGIHQAARLVVAPLVGEVDGEVYRLTPNRTWEYCGCCGKGAVVHGSKIAADNCFPYRFSVEIKGRLAFAFGYVAASIAHFVPLEVCNFVDTLSRFGSIATVWGWAVIAMLRMVAVIHVAVEAFSTVKPRASANEDAPGKPFRAVIAVRGTIVGSGIVVTVGTFRRDSDVDAHLSLCCGSSYRKADSSNCG